jgi:hydrogenase maturation protease
VGLQVAREVKEKLNRQDITLVEASLAGLDTLELLTGYDRAVIIDAIQTREGKVGQLYHLDIAALDNTRHASTYHGINLATALALGRQLRLDLPQKIDLFAIEVADINTFTEKFSPELDKAVPLCVELIARELEGASGSCLDDDPGCTS